MDLTTSSPATTGAFGLFGQDGLDSHAGSGHGAAHPVRLTRRGRLVVVGACAALLLAAFSLGRVDSQAAVPGAEPTPTLTQTVVLPGDTLWSIARELAPDHDPREVVAQIKELNDLSGGLVAGQQLLLPAAA